MTLKSTPNSDRFQETVPQIGTPQLEKTINLADLEDFESMSSSTFGQNEKPQFEKEQKEINEELNLNPSLFTKKNKQNKANYAFSSSNLEKNKSNKSDEGTEKSVHTTEITEKNENENVLEES